MISVSFLLGLSVLGLLACSAGLAYEYDSGCTNLGPYSTTTGQLCYGGGSSSNSQTQVTQQFQIGDRGSAVLALQQTLATAGFTVGRIDGIYGRKTNNAFLRYQVQYPYPVYPIYPIYNEGQPTISGVSGPQSLSVNQQGTWTVTASSPTGANLSY